LQDPIQYIPDTSYLEAISMAYDPIMLVVSTPDSGASKLMTPFLLQVMEKYKGRVQVVRYQLNDEYHEFALSNKIRKFPCVMCMERDEELSRTTGYHSKEDLFELVDKHLLRRV
jgi:thioredoxin-like negative regulator of GroEL